MKYLTENLNIFFQNPKISCEKNNPAPDGDLDGFCEVEEAKQATVILCVLPSALPLTSQKVQEILGIKGK